MSSNRYTKIPVFTKLARRTAPRGIRVYRVGGPDVPQWFTWNRYPGVTIGFAVRVAVRHVLSIVWRKA